MYTLIAFKPAYQFHDRGDDYVLPARCEREDFDTVEALIERVVFLRTDRPLVKYRYGHENDLVFEQFWTFQDAQTLDVTEDVAAQVLAWRRVHDAVNLAREDRRDAMRAESNAKTMERLRVLGIWPRRDEQA